jgi:hypothetical protein
MCQRTPLEDRQKITGARRKILKRNEINQEEEERRKKPCWLATAPQLRKYLNC